MGTVTVRELRHHGGDVFARVSAGESVIVTRDGEPVAELRPRGRRSPSAAQLIARRRSLPPIDAEALRADIDGPAVVGPRP